MVQRLDDMNRRVDRSSRPRRTSQRTHDVTGSRTPTLTEVERVSAATLGAVLGFSEPICMPERWITLSLQDWEMAADDFLLRYLFRNFRPSRHLEFGTWLGDGVVRCVEECDATVWTVNPLEGETLADGRWAY